MSMLLLKNKKIYYSIIYKKRTKHKSVFKTNLPYIAAYK